MSSLISSFSWLRTWQAACVFLVSKWELSDVFTHCNVNYASNLGLFLFVTQYRVAWQRCVRITVLSDVLLPLFSCSFAPESPLLAIIRREPSTNCQQPTANHQLPTAKFCMIFIWGLTRILPFSAVFLPVFHCVLTKFWLCYDQILTICVLWFCQSFAPFWPYSQFWVLLIVFDCFNGFVYFWLDLCHNSYFLGYLPWDLLQYSGFSASWGMRLSENINITH